MNSRDSYFARRDARGRTELNINTSLVPASRPKSNTGSFISLQGPSDRKPPRPLSKSQANGDSTSRALRFPSSTRRPQEEEAAVAAHESFLDNATPVEGAMADFPSRSQRDSHDLSLSPRNVTRDSLVANMLLSLDQFSMGQLAEKYGGGTSQLHSYDDAPQIESSRTWTSSSANPPSRPNGHQYSYSSDLEGADDASRASRGRRSNSSSNFQSSFQRLNSVRESVHRGQTGTSRGVHSRGGRGSKSSSTNSIDGGYGQVLGGQRWTRSGTRSASFDYGPPPTEPAQQQQLQLQQPQQAVQQSPFRVDLSNSLFADEYDAAPTPTVPGGPRRVASSQAIPRPSFDPAEPPSLDRERERKRSPTRSLKSSSGRSKNNTMTAREPPPAMPTLDLDSAPAPHIGYEKSKEVVHVNGQPSGNMPVAQAKERPGFFRRVFGSSKSSTNNASVDSPAPSHHMYPPDIDRSGNSKMQASASNPPSRDASTASTHPVLQKKPSSFFRRRKKSVTEEAPPPLPLAVQAPTLAPAPAAPIPRAAQVGVASERDRDRARHDPSPVSSLRKVMNPYLRNSTAGPGTPAAQAPSPLADITNTSPATPKGVMDNREYKREFSPDYDPSPNARIRTVEPEADDEDLRPADSPSRLPSSRPVQSETRNNSFLNLDNGSDNDDDYMAPAARRNAANTKRADGSPRPPSTNGNDDTLRASRMPTRLEPPDSDDEANPSNLALPIEGARATSPASASTGTDYKSAHSGPPSVRIDSSNNPSPKTLGAFDAAKSKLDEPEFVIGDPTEDDRQKARKIFDGNEDFIQREKAAAWMGEEGPIRQRTLQAYMELYDFKKTSVVQALRLVCQRLVLRAETQQVDRILVAFSKRWCDCNPNHGFKATDVIHTICYSIMLLNTDLHVADIEHKMTRSQFVKNTITTITQAVAEAAPEAFDRPSILPDKGSFGLDKPETPPETDKRSFRNSFRPPPRIDSGILPAEDDDCGPLVKSRFYGSKRAWEEQIELVLKGIYASIRDERLPLFGAEPEKNLNIPSSQSSLSVMGMLKRSPSVLSKAPSESQLSTRGRIADGNHRNGNPRWASKSRSRPGLGRTGFSSSRTSFDDGNSLWSPALSSATWSRYSLGRTQTSVSQDSLGSSFHRGDYQSSIGFANALSQAIIRDEDASGHETAPSILSAEIPISQLLDDESLELAGPPWVKEGNVIHKHHLDGVEKKAKDRHWAEVFAVIQKGQMSLFSFNPSKSTRQKVRAGSTSKGATVVGGGNWQDKATNVGTFSLRQTLASALPPPGYSRTRPHVWALSLPNGAVHLFQVGTPEIIKEFVNTVNYWSARLSTHPLVGGISNIEYGWSDAVVNNALVNAINDTSHPGRISRPGSSAAVGRRGSVGSSFRGSSFDHVAGRFTNNSGGGKLPGDRIHIADWAPPAQSMRPSNSTEAEQLETLDAYVKSIEADLQTHNQLRSPMLLAFSPRSANAAKAMANWERKSAYLLREIVKFRTYVDCLQQAATRRNEIYTERDLARRAARGELSDGDMEVSGDEQEADDTLRD